jgi:hypothetical protein
MNDWWMNDGWMDFESMVDEWLTNDGSMMDGVNTSGKAGAQIPQLPLGDDSSPWGR